MSGLSLNMCRPSLSSVCCLDPRIFLLIMLQFVVCRLIFIVCLWCKCLCWSATITITYLLTYLITYLLTCLLLFLSRDAIPTRFMLWLSSMICLLAKQFVNSAHDNTNKYLCFCQHRRSVDCVVFISQISRVKAR